MKLWALFRIEANVNALLSVDFISILAECLSELEACKLTILFFIFINNLIDTLGLKPVLSPLGQIESLFLLGIFIIVSLLQAANEIREFSVWPLILVKVNFKTISESLPPHKEDELFDHRWTFTISNSINQWFSFICTIAFCLNAMIWWHTITTETPSLVSSHMQPCFFLKIINKWSSNRASLIRNGSSKSLVKPKVIPPFHGN